MRRRRNNIEKPRERRTLVPSFDPEELAQKIENEANCETSRPPYDPAELTRAAEERGESPSSEDDDDDDVFDAFDAEAETETERGILPPFNDDPSSVVEPPSRPLRALAIALDDTAEPDTATDEIGREMYSSYLASDFPEALVLAEQVLEREPAHALAQLVVDRCRERLRTTTSTLSPSSVVRLKFAELERQSKHIDARTSFVLGHVDGVTDAGTVAALSGLPGPEALDRLHALLDLGVIEVVA